QPTPPRMVSPSATRLRISAASASSPFTHSFTPTSGINRLSLPDALPLSPARRPPPRPAAPAPCWSPTRPGRSWRWTRCRGPRRRSEEHTSELQSRENLVCRLLLEKKKHRRRSNLTLNFLSSSHH